MYELLIANKETGKIWNAANCTEEVTLETVRTGGPSKLAFTIANSEGLEFNEGDVVRFSADGELQFYGWVFRKVVDRYGVMQVTAYDRVRYLKAHATYAFYGMTASEIVQQIAEDLQISVGDIADTGYRIPYLIKQDQPCIDIIQDALNQTLLNTGLIYVLYDNGSGLSLKSSAEWQSGYVLGDKSLLTDYSYKTDIDTQTYNSVKLVTPNESTGRHEVVMVQDSENIAKWGLLQLYQRADNLNLAQMRERAKQTLNFYNRVHKTLTLSSVGINGLRAGMLIRVMIEKLGGLNQFILIESVHHTWHESDHTMEVETLEL